MRAIATFIVAVVGAIGVVGAPAPAVASDASWSHLEAEFVARINDLRASEGLAPLAVHGNLVEKARGWAAIMAGEGRIWHSNLPEGITADWLTLGENVGVGPSVPSLHDAFVASASHYANLVKPEFEYVGIGVVVTADGTIYVAEEFMTLKDSRPPVTAPPAVDDAPTPLSTAGGTVDPTPDGAPTPDRAAAPSSTPSTPAAPDRLSVVLRHLQTLDG